MKTITQIYALKDPRNQEIRYIGKTIQPLKTRLCGHIAESVKSKHHKACWIQSLTKIGLKPEIELIEKCYTENWKEREKYWINHFRNLNRKLTNVSDGGDDNSAIWNNPEYRQRHSGIHHHMKLPENKLKVTGSKNGMFGKRHSPEALKKISEASKKQIITQETCKKISLALCGKLKSESHRKNISLSRRKLNEEQIKLIFSLRENGLSLTEIANHIGNISYVTVSRILNKKVKYLNPDNN